ncbi:MAG: HEAT repeat domain-containing protein, partial [Pedobacter sp.]
PENSLLPDFQIAELNPEEELQALLARLATVMDEDSYLTLVRQAITCADLLKASHVLTPLLPLAKLLSTHAVDASRSENLIECARFGVEQLAMGDEFIAFLFDRMDNTDGVSRELVLAILTVAGPAALSLAVEKMCSIDKLAVRKKFSILIVKLGEPAVPSLLAMLEDSRWYIVRSLVTILGDIGSPTAVPGLHKCLPHTDIRVGKEAIRSLAKIGGKEAEDAIISIVRANNPSLLPQAFTSLGGMKSKKALGDLMYIIHSEDMLLKTLSFKTSALAAISLIGDQHVTPYLVKLLEKRHLIARSRWEQLKIAVALCLSKLGDPRALPVLRKMAGTSGELGQACAEAANSIERTGGSPHGGT